MDWLHTLNREWLEHIANRLLMELAMTILDRSGSRIVSIDFVDNPYHSTYADEKGELCRMHAKDGTTTCHRYCTTHLVSNGKVVTLAMTYVRSDEKEADTVEDALDRVEAYPFEIELLLADRGFYNERILRRSREIAATVVPVQKKGKRMRKKLDTHYSYMMIYRITKAASGNWNSRSRSLCLITPEIVKKAAKSFEAMWRAAGRSHAETSRTPLLETVSD